MLVAGVITEVDQNYAHRQCPLYVREYDELRGLCGRISTNNGTITIHWHDLGSVYVGQET